MAARSRRALHGRCQKIQSHFEQLEIRTLFNVISVTDFGARPNDGNNDLPAIQAALNASNPGDTILFSGGEFDLSGFGKTGGDGLIVPSNRTYLGQNGASLRGHDSQGPQIHVTGDNVTISGLTFQDGGLKVDKGSNLNNNIVIDNNVFNTNTGGVNNNGLTATSGLVNSSITNNYFTGVSNGFGILAFNWQGLTIANNEFVNIKAGVHMQGFGGSRNLRFEQNYFSGVRGGMGAEIVSNSNITNCTFQDNYYENPNQGNLTHDQLLNFMAFSFPTPTCTNTIIRRNTVIAPQRPDGIGVRIGIETAGNGCDVEDNYVVGCEWGITDADGTTPSDVSVQNNLMIGAVNKGIRQDHPAPGRSLTQNNNGPNATLSWDINRPKPGIDSRLPGTGGSNAVSTPASPPPASPPPASPPPASPPPASPPPPPPPPVVSTSAPTKTPTTDVPVITPAHTLPSSPPPPPAPPKPVAPKSPPPIPLAAPGQLVATAVSTSRIDLTWQDTNTKETGYKIERSWDGVNWAQIAVVGANATTYSNTGLPAGISVYYRVIAYATASASAYSNVVNPSTPLTNPTTTIITTTTTTPNPVTTNPTMPGSSPVITTIPTRIVGTSPFSGTTTIRMTTTTSVLH